MLTLSNQWRLSTPTLRISAEFLTEIFCCKYPENTSIDYLSTLRLHLVMSNVREFASTHLQMQNHLSLRRDVFSESGRTAPSLQAIHLYMMSLYSTWTMIAARNPERSAIAAEMHGNLSSFHLVFVEMKNASLHHERKVYLLLFTLLIFERVTYTAVQLSVGFNFVELIGVFVVEFRRNWL